VPSDPDPPLSSLVRASRVRVSIAIPIFADPRANLGAARPILGVVFDSRTPPDVPKSVWLIRDELVEPALLSALLTALVVVGLTIAISRPLSRLTRTAERVAGGERGLVLGVAGFAPEEVLLLTASLERMRKELEAQAGYIKEFAANAAHELKTPLTSLRGAAELLLDDGGAMSKEQARRFLANIQQDAVRMDALVGRLLHLARIEAAPAVREPVDLRAFLDGVAERYRRGGNAIELAYAAPSRAVRLQPEQLESLLSNLLDNAVRHGAGRPVALSVGEDSRGLLVEVRDRGPASSPERFERLFERFYTTERERGGTGLGLSIVRAIAEAHGGSAWAVRHDEGLSFFALLPLR
jgi:two-component system sensor histidine kinase ChvG